MSSSKFEFRSALCMSRPVILTDVKNAMWRECAFLIKMYNFLFMM